MEESACHEMVIYLLQRFSSMLCFLHFFISYKYDFHVDAKRTIVKTREQVFRWVLIVLLLLQICFSFVMRET